jgi:hypothetical protein
MKKSVKKLALVIAETITKNGKKAFYIKTNLRLSVDDFKSLMSDIRTADGFGFVKYEAGIGRVICAIKIESETLLALAMQYTWTEPIPKAKKETAKIAIKSVAKKQAEIDALSAGEFTPEMLAQFKAFLQAMKAGSIA